MAERRDRKGGARAPARQPSSDDASQLEGATFTPLERALLSDVFAIVDEQAPSSTKVINRANVEMAFAFACEHHADQRVLMAEDFIHHPVGVAKICAGMRLDTETLCAALLHDTVEDTSASLTEVRHAFGYEIANIVDGVTKLTGIVFQSRDDAQAENYRKMMVAMAPDVRVILIMLADRLQTMRTIDVMPKQKQIDKAKETLKIFAPIAEQLGIYAIKWELEDLAFAALHPRKYDEIKNLVNQQRDERERYVENAGQYLLCELRALGIEADISGRAKHFYSIYSKMTKKGREFNEIYDLTAMRVIVDNVKDCYGAVGVAHSLWKPLPGRFKDFIAMPKFNMYQSVHTTVIGPEGLPLEIQVRTQEMQEMAEFGAAKLTQVEDDGLDGRERLKWLYAMLDRQAPATNAELLAPKEFADTIEIRGPSSASDYTRQLGALAEEEVVYVFTPKGEVKNLSAGATPLDFAYEVHTEVGHRCVGAKVNGKMVPLHYELKSGDIVEVLTSNRERGPSRDWLAVVHTTRARNKIRDWFRAEARGDAEHDGRELLYDALSDRGLPHQKIISSPLLADVIREMGFKKADEFYIALGSAKINAKTVVKKVMRRLKQGEAAEGEQRAAAEDMLSTRRQRRQPTSSSTQHGIHVEGVDDVMLRLAKCCRPVPGDEIVGYISLGRGITIHREDCPNAVALCKDPDRFTPVTWEGDHEISFEVELQVDAWDRQRLLEDLSRTFAEAGISIVEARSVVSHPMVHNWFVVDIDDLQVLRRAIGAVRELDSVFDAYRVTPRRRSARVRLSRRSSATERAKPMTSHRVSPVREFSDTP